MSTFHILNLGGADMSKDTDHAKKKRARSSVNPQGYSEDVADQEPKSQLEQRAKKKNTKI